MPGAPLLISLNGTPLPASAFSIARRSGHVVGRDEVERAVGEARPQRVAIGGATERRRDHEPGARRGIGIVVALLGQDEVVRARLGRDARRRPPGPRRTSSSAAADERWTTWTGASAIRANASARAVATAST